MHLETEQAALMPGDYAKKETIQQNTFHKSEICPIADVKMDLSVILNCFASSLRWQLFSNSISFGNTVGWDN